MKKLMILIIITLLILPIVTSTPITLPGEKFFGCNFISEKHIQIFKENDIETNNQMMAVGANFLIKDENPDYDDVCRYSENIEECKSCVMNIVQEEKNEIEKNKEDKIKTEKSLFIAKIIFVLVILSLIFLLYRTIKNKKSKERKLWITLLLIGLSICILCFITLLYMRALFSAAYPT
jgi:hypothetical protein